MRSPAKGRVAPIDLKSAGTLASVGATSFRRGDLRYLQCRLILILYAPLIRYETLASEWLAAFCTVNLHFAEMLFYGAAQAGGVL